MKIAIGACFFTKRDVDIDASHFAKIRYKNDLCTEEKCLEIKLVFVAFS